MGIRGENLPHVSHYFRDPHDYFRRRLLIVGGKNSAAEAALRCWRAGAQVIVSYRQARFDERRVKHWLLPDLYAQIETGMIRINQPTSGVDFHAPFGGERQSSYGPREQGKAAREHYTSTHTITIGPAG